MRAIDGTAHRIAGTVRNSPGNVNITAGNSTQFAGALAGTNQEHQQRRGAERQRKCNVIATTAVHEPRRRVAGQNNPGGTIDGSPPRDGRGGRCQQLTVINFAGGLVQQLGSITNSSATGNVSGGAFSYVGGFVGQNGLVCNCAPSGPGTIAASFATGTASGSGNVQLGGFVGVNAAGTIDSSNATGNVIGTNRISGPGGSGDTAAAGGFAGSSNGTITNSHAAGNVSVGGAVFGDFVAGGFVGVNNGLVQGQNGVFTYATGSVTGGARTASRAALRD